VGIFDRLDRLADQLGELIVPDDVRAHVELGQAYLGAGDLAGASRELDAALALRPDHARAAYLLGIVYQRRGDREGARDLYTRAAVREGFIEPQLALGQLALLDGDLDLAVEGYRRALDLGTGDPDTRAEAYRGLGTAHLRAGRYDRAVRELRKAVASSPDEITAQTLLGRALLFKGDLDTARICLERATRKEPAPPIAWASLGDVVLALGRTDEAEAAFRAALAGVAAGSVRDADADEAQRSSHLGLARLLRGRGQLDLARQEVLQALAVSPANLALLVELGRIAALAHSPEVALDAFDRALVGGVESGARVLGDQKPLLEEALVISLRAGLTTRAASYARALVARTPDHASARAALALVALGSDDASALESAEAELSRAEPAAAARSVDVRLAEAAIALRRGARDKAQAALLAAAELGPDDLRPKERYAALFQRDDLVRGDVGALLASAHRFAASAPELVELAPPLGRLRESLDRPLVVTVMGEFNAGKSTFVNAFLGEEVAPMGITPTTATVNVLKYGAERKGRVLYLDDTTREIPWTEVPTFLKKLESSEAKRIRVVELLYPLEVLQRINVVDTPGLNSIHPEHEEVARRFVDEADAVIWLFSVDQAAKASEGEALTRIAAAGRKILGVLNKIDRASDDERAQIIKHVEDSLGERLEAIVPVSARGALAARRDHDDAALAASNYPTLDATLESRFFSRARLIQRQAALRRARVLVSEAASLVEKKLSVLSTREHDAALTAARAEALLFTGEFLPAERRRLLEASEDALKICAREVLDFVRPRRTFLGSNEATPADRDFLLTLLEERVTAALGASRERVRTKLAVAVALLAALPGHARTHELDGLIVHLDEQVYGRYRAFVRGYLRGGAVRAFFVEELPRLDLTEGEVRRALERAAPLDDDTLERELRTPLRAFGERFYATVLASIDRHRGALALERFDLECRLGRSIETLIVAIDTALAAP